MIKKLYLNFRKLFYSSSEGKGISAGIIQRYVRNKVFNSFFTFPKRGLLLDLGCGEGLFINKFANKEGIIGVDMLFSQAKDASRKTGAKIVVASAQKLPFKRNTFFRVTALNFFINIWDRENILDIFGQVKEVLEKEGEFIFETRSSLNPFNILRFKLASVYDGTLYKNPRMYSPSYIKKAAKKSGFRIGKVIYSSFAGIFSSVIIWQLKVKRYNV